MNYEELFGPIKPKSKYSSSTMTIVMGHAGVGKTVLATTAQKLGKCVLINFENRIGHIEETENLRFIPRSNGEFREDKICTYSGFKDFCNLIFEGSFKVDYIIIDTVDSMFDIFLKYQKPFFKDQRQTYSMVYDEIYELFKKLKESGCNLILTSHVVNDPILEKITVSLNEKLRNKLNVITDNIFFYDALEDETRVLKLKSDAKTKCKLTTLTPESHSSAPQEIINPSWENIEELLKSA